MLLGHVAGLAVVLIESVRSVVLSSHHLDAWGFEATDHGDRGIAASQSIAPSNARELALVVSNMSVATALSLLKANEKQYDIRGLDAVVDEIDRYVSHGVTAPGDVDASEQALNEVLLQSRKRLDLEQTKCAEYDSKQTQLLDQARAEVGEMNAQSAGAKARSMKAQTTMGLTGTQMPKLNEQLEKKQAQCAKQKAALRQQLNTTRRDLSVTETISFPDCKAASASAALLDFRRDVLTTAQSRMTSEAGQHVVQVLLGDHNGSAAFEQQKQDPMPAAEGPTSNRAQRKKCAPGGEASCATMRDKLLSILTGMSDKLMDIQKDLVRAERVCEESIQNMNDQIDFQDTRQKEAQAQLAEAAQIMGDADQQSSLKETQARGFQRDYDETMAKCKTSIRAFEDEICSARKLRGELYKMSNIQRNAQDCEVSEWIPEECPVSCGGATQRLKRRISMVPNQYGAGCPPVEMERRCNEQSCPIDCEVGAWSRWSSCTVRCGGGVRQRARLVEMQPMFNGKPCSATSAAEKCNVGACDKDCVLSEWTDWATCSKECDGGLRTRKKEVTTEAVGKGRCADRMDPSRLGYKPCNERICRLPANASLTCKSKLDVIVLLAGAAGLREEGWAAFQKAGEMLIRAFPGGKEGVQLAMMLYSGPGTWDGFKRCTRAPGDSERVNMKDDCGIDWVSHFSDNPESVADKVPSLKWPAGTSFTSGALMATLVELRYGRRDAASVVVVISDGASAMSPAMTAEAAALVRNRARLIWVPVTEFGQLDQVKSWASSPSEANVIKVPGAKALANPATISSIVANICPKVNEAPPAYDPLNPIGAEQPVNFLRGHAKIIK